MFFLQLKVAKALNALIRDQPSIRQFCKETEWLQHLLTYLPNFEDTAVLGTSTSARSATPFAHLFAADELLLMVETLSQHHISAKQVSLIFRLLQSDKPKFKAYCWTHIFQLLQRLWHGRAGSPNDYFEFDGNMSVRFCRGLISTASVLTNHACFVLSKRESCCPTSNFRKMAILWACGSQSTALPRRS